MFTLPSFDEYVLDEHALDTAHRDLFAALARLVALPSVQFAPAFEHCVEGMESDFRAEESLMEDLALKTMAPHREQHARVLAALHHAAAALAQGDAGPAHRAVLLLEEWLPVHIGTMDKALVDAAREARATDASAPGHPARGE